MNQYNNFIISKAVDKAKQKIQLNKKLLKVGIIYAFDLPFKIPRIIDIIIITIE